MNAPGNFPPLSGAASLASELTGQGRYTGHDGAVFDRGSAMHPAFVPVLLDAYRRSAAAGDWWSPEAKRLADELEAAICAAGNPEQRKAA